MWSRSSARCDVPSGRVSGRMQAIDVPTRGARDMATLTVWRFDSPQGADMALDTLADLQKRELITVHDAATVSWYPDHKKPTTRQANNLVGGGALGGGFWGLLLGLIFFVPLLGAAIGAAFGALGGAM